MRLVVDTNLVVSALLWRGTPHLLLATIDDYPVEFYTSRVLLDELADVLPRKKLARAVQATGETPTELFRSYQHLAHVVRPRRVPRVVRDVDDDHVVACAVTARADYLVTGDRDLLVLDHYRKIKFVTARRALELVTHQATQ